MQQRTTIRHRELLHTRQLKQSARSRGFTSRCKFCIAGREATTRQAQALRHNACARGDMAGHAWDTAGGRPRYDRGVPPYGAQRTLCERPERSAHTMCTQPGSVGCAPYAPNSVLTQDTVLSHCLNHCSGTLFTRFSKKINKIK